MPLLSLPRWIPSLLILFVLQPQKLSQASHLGALRVQGVHGAVIAACWVPHSLCEDELLSTFPSEPWDFLRGGSQRSFPFHWEDNSHFIVRVKNLP